ncbi:MAG: DNA topology modulation protein [Pyrinomonadaceae bacterium]|nr:DNA topology modulation protein [Pyrinomonadaceae bacterium]
MKRVLVIGSCGAGKSTFARRLHRSTGLKVFHLDRYYHLPNWEQPSDEEWFETVQELVKNPEWIIDGNFGGTMEFRMQHCDTVIWLDFPRVVCTWRILKRMVTYWNRTRPDMAEGCNERFDWDFLKYVWNFPKDRNPALEARLQKFKEKKVFHLRSNGAVEQFLSELEK